MDERQAIIRLMQKHDRLMQRLGEWFKNLQTRYPDKIQCGRGCSRCCYGLFDISLPDVIQIIRGFDRLPEETKMAIRQRACLIEQDIRRESGIVMEPLFLKISQENIDELVERIRDVRCPFLGEGEECLIYDQRPLACRIEGVPMIDMHDGIFGDWCDKNFRVESEFSLPEELRLDYYEIQAIEENTAKDLSQFLFPVRHEEVTIFVPSVITGCEEFRKAFGLF